MSAQDYGEGVPLLGATWVPVIAGVELLRRRRLGHLHGVPMVLAFAVMLVVGLAGVHLVPGILGILTPGTVVVTALLALGAIAWLVPAAPGGPAIPGAPDPVSPSTRLGWAFAAVGAAAIGTVLLGALLHFARKTYGATDLISFDLPALAGWVQTKSLWHITELFPFQTHGTYPQNSILTLLSVSLPFRNDAFLRAIVYPAVPLAGLAVYALGRELRAPASTAALAGAVFAACPVVAAAAEGAALDAIATVMFATGVYFLVRSVRTAARGDLVLAGLGLGFALGAKWYHLTAVAAVVGVW